jgi:hypothetical protein
LTRYRHHGHRIVGVVEPARRAPTRDSFSEPVSVYGASGGPRRAALPDPATIEMPSPKAKDEGTLWRTICELGQPDGAGDLAGQGEDGRVYRLLRTDGGFTLEVEEKEDVALQPIGDRRAGSSRDSEAAALREIQRKNDALWARPFK